MTSDDRHTLDHWNELIRLIFSVRSYYSEAFGLFVIVVYIQQNARIALLTTPVLNRHFAMLSGIL